jgi:methyl-CpG-binding domain protein 4
MMIQDIYRGEPWKMLVACILLNQTTGIQVKKMMRGFFAKYPTIGSLRKANELELADDISMLGLQNVKAQRIKAFIKDYDDGNPIKDMAGVGDYAVESYNVFVNRKLKAGADDKEINKYLEHAIKCDFMVERLTKHIEKCGFEEVVAGNRMKELINFPYEYGSSTFCRITDDRLEYVLDKLATYREALLDVVMCLRKDPTSRQAVIQLDQSPPLPNCTVSIQFQIRRNMLILSVFQRSQDVEKIEMDCEIFNRMALEVIKKIEGIDDYRVEVFVGNLHIYL